MSRSFIFTLLAAPLLFAAAESRADSFYKAWTQVYDDTVNSSQFARTMALDARGNVFVAGHVDSGKQLYVAKYDALDGARIWQRTIFASGTNQIFANAMAVDGSGDCVVAGSSNAAGSINYFTQKFSGVDGSNFWSQGANIYDGTAGGRDVALRVITDSSSNVIVTGRSAGSGSGDDIVTLKYLGSNGNQVGGTDRYSAAAGTFNDFPGALIVDGENNIIVGGVGSVSSGTERFAVRKLTPLLGVTWTITPTDTGGEGGVTGLAVDSANNVLATGLARNDSGNFGYYTVKLSSSGSKIWSTGIPSPVSMDTFGSPRPGPIGIVVGADDSPIVSGTLLDEGGRRYIQTRKYTVDGFFGGALSLWNFSDLGLGAGDSTARALAIDGAGNAIVVGESENAAGDADIYVAKYDASSGERIFFNSIAGPSGVDDLGVAVAVSAFGDIAVLGDAGSKKAGNVSFREFTTVKFDRFIAVKGESLVSGTPDDAKYFSGGAPAVSPLGEVTGKVTATIKKKKIGAIFRQGASGGTEFVAAQGTDAPPFAGSPAAKFAAFSDPVIIFTGAVGFTARVTGPPSRSNGLWTDLSGTLQCIMRQGFQAPGLPSGTKLVSVSSFNMRSSSLTALIKVTGPAATKNALVRFDAALTPTVLLRSGMSVTVDGTASEIKSFTSLTPAPASPGDGRWQSNGSTMARVVLKDGRTAIFRIAPTGAIGEAVASGQMAGFTLGGSTPVWKNFGLPAVDPNAARIGFLGFFQPIAGTIDASSDSALISGAGAASLAPFAREGDFAPTALGNASSLRYASFSDPVFNSNGEGAFFATLRGPGSTAKNNKALFFGDVPPAASTVHKIAQTNDIAAAGAVEEGANPEPVTRYRTLLNFVLPGGTGAGPIFVARLSGAATPKTDTGLFAVERDGVTTRRLLRTGDRLGTQTVKTFTLLKAVPKVFATARSFNDQGAVVLLVTFTNRSTALIRLPTP